MKVIFHILIVVLLTLLTQIGGVVWVINFGYFRVSRVQKSRLFRTASFVSLYLLTTLLAVPLLAKVGGRTPLPLMKTGLLVPHTYLTPLLNRHYVKLRLKSELIGIAKKVGAGNNNLKLSYLDANFPFLDGFPLLPHLSHNDGKKVDLSFYYKKDGQTGNLKPSNSGYGIFVEPIGKEMHQSKDCVSRGYWQYGSTKFLTLGSRDDLEFDLTNTRNLVKLIVKVPSTQKLFIEPHLEKRLNLNSEKIRFQGCHAVRHDDHIHYQIK